MPLRPVAQADLDVPCVSCGYCLRGLPPDGRCPECGEPLATSLHERLLRFADPRWVAHLRAGAGLAYGGTVGFVLLWYTHLGFLISGANARFQHAAECFFTAAYGALCIVAMGIWLLTTPEPGESRWTPGRWVRMACRGGMSLALVAHGLALAAIRESWGAMTAFQLAGILIVAMWVAFGFLHVARLSLRLPSIGLRRLSYACLVLLVFAHWPLVPPVLVAFGGKAQLPSIVPTIGKCMFFSYCLSVWLLLHWLWRGVRKASAEAGRYWSSVDCGIETSAGSTNEATATGADLQG